MVEKIVSADEVREYVLVAIIKPARRKGEKTITVISGNIQKLMGIDERNPLVCGSLDTNKFLTYADLKLISREGPKQSSTVKWVFEI